MESYLRHHVCIQIKGEVVDQQINVHRMPHREALDSIIQTSEFMMGSLFITHAILLVNKLQTGSTKKMWVYL